MMTVAAVDHFSFPSGHTTRVVMLAALAHHFGVAPALLSWIYLWAAATSFSRIMLGMCHHLSPLPLLSLLSAIAALSGRSLLWAHSGCWQGATTCLTLPLVLVLAWAWHSCSLQACGTLTTSSCICSRPRASFFPGSRPSLTQPCYQRIAMVIAHSLFLIPCFLRCAMHHLARPTAISRTVTASV